jgi:hypothetical protein
MKKILIVSGLTLALTFPLAAFAATSNTPAAQAFRGFCGIDTAKLTEKQKTDLNNQWQKMQELKKETVNKMVANGSITKEQGALTIRQLETTIQNHQANGFCGNYGGQNGRGRGQRGMGRGPGGNCCAAETVTK